jgi:hypothetical protein
VAPDLPTWFPRRLVDWAETHPGSFRSAFWFLLWSTACSGFAFFLAFLFDDVRWGFGGAVCLGLIAFELGLLSALDRQLDYRREQATRRWQTAFSWSVTPLAPASPFPTPFEEEQIERFERRLPRWERKIDAPADFDDYLRAQLVEAVTTTALAKREVQGDMVTELADYVARLLHDGFARHEIMACLTVPDAWKLPKEMRKGIGKRGYAIYWNRLRIKAQRSPALEISYQLFGEDLNVVRIGVPEDKDLGQTSAPPSVAVVPATTIDPLELGEAAETEGPGADLPLSPGEAV